MKPLSLPRLLVLQRQRIERAFGLEERGQRAQAARVWFAVDRLARHGHRHALELDRFAAPVVQLEGDRRHVVACGELVQKLGDRTSERIDRLIGITDRKEPNPRPKTQLEDHTM